MRKAETVIRQKIRKIPAGLSELDTPKITENDRLHILCTSHWNYVIKSAMISPGRTII